MAEIKVETIPYAEPTLTGLMFKKWLLEADTGERAFYYLGEALSTRDGHKRHIGVVAYQAHEQGLVRLVQRRMSKKIGVFRYEAVRSGKAMERFVGELAQV